MEEKTDALKDRLLLARKRRGMTQMQLAEVSGLKQSDISKLERGKALSTSAIARLALALSVSPQWLELNVGAAPDWLSPSVASPAAPAMTRAELLAHMPGDWRELILAYEELLPEHRAEMVRPLLSKADEMRRHFEASLIRQGIKHHPMITTGNNLPMAPKYTGPERRHEDQPHSEERRGRLLQTHPAKRKHS